MLIQAAEQESMAPCDLDWMCDIIDTQALYFERFDWMMSVISDYRLV